MKSVMQRISNKEQNKLLLTFYNACFWERETWTLRSIISLPLKVEWEAVQEIIEKGEMFRLT